MLETVEGGTSSGNKVSLTQILRATKLKYVLTNLNHGSR